MSKKVSIDGLADAIIKELREYNQDVTDGLKKEIQDAGTLCRKELKATSPKLTGDYAKGIYNCNGGISYAALRSGRSTWYFVLFHGYAVVDRGVCRRLLLWCGFYRPVLDAGGLCDGDRGGYRAGDGRRADDGT